MKPSYCDVPKTNVEVNLIARFDDKYEELDLHTFASGFDFLSQLNYEPNNSFIYTNKWTDIFKAFLEDRNMRMQI